METEERSNTPREGRELWEVDFRERMEAEQIKANDAAPIQVLSKDADLEGQKASYDVRGHPMEVEEETDDDLSCFCGAQTTLFIVGLFVGWFLLWGIAAVLPCGRLCSHSQKRMHPREIVFWLMNLVAAMASLAIFVLFVGVELVD